MWDDCRRYHSNQNMKILASRFKVTQVNHSSILVFQIFLKEITTEKRKLFLSDKYSEMGILLPTRKCFGLGIRNNAKLMIEEGLYTL